MDRKSTIRKEIVKLLMVEPMTTLDISGQIGISERDVEEHLTHALISASHKYRVITTPPQCRVCNFEFKERKRVKKPSKCPECKNGSIERATYFIDDGK